MLTLPTMETAILDRAHLVGIAAPEHLGHKVIIVARIITRTKLFKLRPVIGKYLFEDVPVPRGVCNHQGAPSWGIGIVAVPLFYHGSPPSVQLLIGLHRGTLTHLSHLEVTRTSG